MHSIQQAFGMSLNARFTPANFTLSPADPRVDEVDEVQVNPCRSSACICRKAVYTPTVYTAQYIHSIYSIYSIYSKQYIHPCRVTRQVLFQEHIRTRRCAMPYVWLGWSFHHVMIWSVASDSCLVECAAKKPLISS